MRRTREDIARIKDVLKSNFVRRPGCHVEAVKARRFVCRKFGHDIPENVTGKYIAEVLGVEKVRRRVGPNNKRVAVYDGVFLFGEVEEATTAREGQIMDASDALKQLEEKIFEKQNILIQLDEQVRENKTTLGRLSEQMIGQKAELHMVEKHLHEAKEDLSNEIGKLRDLRVSKRIYNHPATGLIKYFECNLTELALSEKLGEGAFGSVHKCTYNDLEAACKQLRNTSSVDLQYEVKILLSLNTCSYTPMLYAFDSINRPQKILMQCIANAVPLHDLKDVTEMRAASLTKEIIKGVVHLHTWNILHNDLHPGNILIANMTKPFIIDFGKACYKGDEGSEKYSRAKRRRWARDFPWIAPEIVKGYPVSELSDAYSVGYIVHVLYRKRIACLNTKDYVKFVCDRLYVKQEESRMTLKAVLSDYQDFI